MIEFDAHVAGRMLLVLVAVISYFAACATVQAWGDRRRGLLLGRFLSSSAFTYVYVIGPFLVAGLILVSL